MLPKVNKHGAGQKQLQCTKFSANI
jgi:hypothetical protein